MLLRIIKYIVIAAIIIYGFGWFYYNDGAVTITWMDYEVETTVAFAFICIALSFLLVSGFYNSIIYLIRLPFNFLENRRIRNEIESLKKLQIANYFLHKHDYDFAENFINKRPNGYVLHEELSRALLLKAQGNNDAVIKILEKFKDDPELKFIAKSIEIDITLSNDFALGRGKLNEELEKLDSKKDAQYFLDNICYVSASYLQNSENAEGVFWYEKAYKISSRNFKVKLTELLIALKNSDFTKAKKLIEKNTYLQNNVIAKEFVASKDTATSLSLTSYLNDILLNNRTIG